MTPSNELDGLKALEAGHPITPEGAAFTALQTTSAFLLASRVTQEVITLDLGRFQSSLLYLQS